MNAYAEHFVRSIKSECLNKLVLLGEGHLHAAVREYVAHYHEERNHQGLGGQLIVPPANLNRPGPIVFGSALAGSCASTSARRPETPDRVFAHYGVATLRNAYGLDNEEEGFGVWVCAGPVGSWSERWDDLVRYAA